MTAVATDGPIITVEDAGICFSTGKRHRSAREFLFKGSRGQQVRQFWALRDISFQVRPASCCPTAAGWRCGAVWHR
jgi:hypothetical protein